MYRIQPSAPHRAAVVPLVAICLMGLLGFIALAVDLGVLMIARNECQNAADAAAMAGARTLNGDTNNNNNYSNVQPNAQAAAASNKILNQAVAASQLTLTIGDYYYDSTTAAFKINATGRATGDNWTLTQATVTSPRPSYFSKIFSSTNTSNISAMATAAHRPRDAVIVIDFSGSMRFDSLLGAPYTGSRTNSMNPDTVYPTFGHYTGNSSEVTWTANLTASGGEIQGAANDVTATSDGGPIVDGFYGDTAAFGTSTPAFTSASSGYATTPAGVPPLKTSYNSTSTYASNVKTFLDGSQTTRDWRFELDGYSAYSNGSSGNPNTMSADDYTNAPFAGNVQGPGYWGKTFWTWPPDPRMPLNTTFYTSTQIQNIVQQFLKDFGYTADFNNSSVLTTLSANLNSTSATSITVSSATNFPTAVPFKIIVGTTSGSAPNIVFSTGSSLEIMNVTAVSGSTWTVQRGQDGTTAATFSNGKSVGMLTAPPLYGLYTAAASSVSPAGRTPAGSSLWTGWTSSTLGTFLTGNVYKPGTPSGSNRKAKLATSDAEYHQILRLYNRVGAGMPKNSASNPVACDWRARFFLMPDGVTPLSDNSRLYNSGSLNAPSNTTYLINYNAIMDWIKNCGTNPFPNQLRAGGCIYYTAIPSTINNSAFPPTDPNQRFWKEYVDEVLGLQQTGGTSSNPTYSVITDKTGYGDDIGWGTTATSGVPAGWPTTTYMSYTDNPNRPLLHFWFGPMTLIDYLGNYNMGRFWWPGTVREAPTYQTKLGVQAALKDVFYNHPNDNVSLIFFSSPKASSGGTGYYNYARAPLGRDYVGMVNALWFSPKVISTDAEIKLYNSSGVFTGDIYDVPRANGGTCYAMPLMLAYNQFSANSTLVNFTANASAGTAGGQGRNGAAKLLIFETDGMVNTGAAATLVSSTTGQGYYPVRIADANNWSNGSNEFPSSVSGVTFSTGATQSTTITQQICNNLSAGGFSTTRKPVKVHCIAFGSLFDASNGSSNKTNALQNLANLEIIGGVQTTGATTLAANKIVVGNFTTRINNLQSAFSSILQDGVQVVLLSSGSGLP